MDPQNSSPAQPPSAPGEGNAVCALCGTPAPGGAPPTWTCSVENGSRRYFCVDCARAHLRAIEGRLDPSRW
ncbi:hypothetical protein ACIQM4_06240 [Streptomyces sp. NPDC091272]|uniref:hypothetical protein n=1 Tax=Streptomyces sp. NPDC091272 TaxID=3365981 RepID=UPI0037F3B825